jgi:hypothetical protein
LPTWPQKCADLRDAALALLQAAQKKDYDQAKKLAAVMAQFPNLKHDDTPHPSNPAPKNGLGMEDIMRPFSASGARLEKTLAGDGRLDSAQLAGPGRAEEATDHAYQVAALACFVQGHTPAKDEKGQSRKVWQEASADMQRQALEMALAARAKDTAGLHKAYSSLAASCTQCHKVFRTEDE